MSITERSASTSTSRERLCARTRMQMLDMNTAWVGEEHRDLFRAAGIDWEPRRGLDAVLSSLSAIQIAALNGVLLTRCKRAGRVQ